MVFSKSAHAVDAEDEVRVSSFLLCPSFDLSLTPPQNKARILLQLKQLEKVETVMEKLSEANFMEVKVGRPAVSTLVSVPILSFP